MAENTEKRDLKNVNLAKFDFRELYLTDEQLNKWEEWNPLYKAVWFRYKINEKRAEIDEDGPLKCYKYGDIECHPVAFDVYAELYKDEKKQHIYVYKDNHFTVANNSNLAVSADVMNGWWGPVKLFLRQSNRGSSSTLIQDLKSELKSHNKCANDLNSADYDILFPKMANTTDENKQGAFTAMLEFLKVVYTIGNFSPIPTGGCQGGGALDNWACKLYRNMIWGWVGLLESLSCLEVQREKYYALHKFEGYINNGKPTAYWKSPKDVKKDPRDFSRPEKSAEWKTYFEKTTELITNRSKALLSGNEDKIKDILISYYLSPSETSSGNT